MEDFSYQLMAMQSQFHKQLLKKLENTELSTGQPKVLAYLWHHEGNSQKAIAQACMLEPGSLTVLLKRMEKQGIVERRYLDGNLKTRDVYLTEYGRELAKLTVESFFAVEEMAFSGFSEDERAVFLQLCVRMRENLSS